MYVDSFSINDVDVEIHDVTRDKADGLAVTDENGKLLDSYLLDTPIDDLITDPLDPLQLPTKEWLTKARELGGARSLYTEHNEFSVESSTFPSLNPCCIKDNMVYINHSENSVKQVDPSTGYTVATLDAPLCTYMQNTTNNVYLTYINGFFVTSLNVPAFYSEEEQAFFSIYSTLYKRLSYRANAEDSWHVIASNVQSAVYYSGKVYYVTDAGLYVYEQGTSTRLISDPTFTSFHVISTVSPSRLMVYGTGSSYELVSGSWQQLEPTNIKTNCVIDGTEAQFVQSGSGLKGRNIGYVWLDFPSVSLSSSPWIDATYFNARFIILSATGALYYANAPYGIDATTEWHSVVLSGILRKILRFATYVLIVTSTKTYISYDGETYVEYNLGNSESISRILTYTERYALYAASTAMYILDFSLRTDKKTKLILSNLVISAPLLFFNGLWLTNFKTNNIGYRFCEDGHTFLASNIPNGQATVLIKGEDFILAGVASKGLWYSTTGKTFTQCSGIPANATLLRVLLVNNLAFAVTSSHLYVAQDKQNYSSLSIPFNANNIRNVVYYRNLYIVSVTSSGLWYSEDLQTWTQETDTRIATASLTITVVGSRLIVGNSSLCLYTYDLQSWNSFNQGEGPQTVSAIFSAERLSVVINEVVTSNIGWLITDTTVTPHNTISYGTTAADRVFMNAGYAYLAFLFSTRTLTCSSLVRNTSVRFSISQVSSVTGAFVATASGHIDGALCAGVFIDARHYVYNPLTQ